MNIRNDGDHVAYVVQHQWANGLRPDAWAGTNLGHLMFVGLGWQDKQGAVGDRRRALLDPWHEGWQEIGSHCFLRLEDALAVLVELRAAHDLSDISFRVARVEVRMLTTPIGEGVPT